MTQALWQPGMDRIIEGWLQIVFGGVPDCTALGRYLCTLAAKQDAAGAAAIGNSFAKFETF